MPLIRGPHQPAPAIAFFIRAKALSVAFPRLSTAAVVNPRLSGLRESCRFVTSVLSFLFRERHWSKLPQRVLPSPPHPSSTHGVCLRPPSRFVNLRCISPLLDPPSCSAMLSSSWSAPSSSNRASLSAPDRPRKGSFSPLVDSSLFSK